MPRNQCPSCTGTKYSTAKQCKACAGNNNSRPAKGWYQHSTGYIVRCGINIDGRELHYQHRIVMEEYLGRRLDSSEHIHHLDGDKTNNSIENLELILACEHGREHATTEKMKQMSIKGHERRWGYVSII